MSPEERARLAVPAWVTSLSVDSAISLEKVIASTIREAVAEAFSLVEVEASRRAREWRGRGDGESSMKAVTLEYLAGWIGDRREDVRRGRPQ